MGGGVGAAERAKAKETVTGATMFRLEPLWPDLAVSKTGGEMIIDQTRRLHEGIADGRAHK